MEEKDTEYESGHSIAVSLLAELRRQYTRQSKFTYVLLFVCITLLSYIFYDRWLDSKVESEYVITTDSEIHQDNMTNSDGGGHRIITNAH